MLLDYSFNLEIESIRRNIFNDMDRVSAFNNGQKVGLQMSSITLRLWVCWGIFNENMKSFLKISINNDIPYKEYTVVLLEDNWKI